MRCLFLIILGVLFSSQNVLAKTNCTVTSAIISVDKEPDGKAKLEIKLYNLPKLSSNWALGFFMLQNLSSHNGQQLPMQICEQSTCSNLIIDKRPLVLTMAEFEKPALSSGYTRLLKPVTGLKLQANKPYMVLIESLNSLPQNITAMPQKLFIYDFVTKKVINITALSYQYKNYQADMVAESENRQIKHNWDVTKPITSKVSIIVPLPVKTIFNSGSFQLASSNTIYAPFAQQQIALLIANATSKDLQLYTKVSHKNQASANLQLLPCSTNMCNVIINQPEGYILEINSKNILIYANTNAGYFYAYQSLRQLWNYFGSKIPDQTIIDYPHFQYRGITLDVVRHFFTVNEVKLLLDVMAAHKLNTLHLHLSDDEGWRIQLAQYPELTAIASKRVLGYKLGPTNLVDDKFDISNYQKLHYANADTIYQGFYSQKDIAELIKYANLRQITIIPEIEMPGHARALKKSLPKIFFVANDRSDYYSIQGYRDNTLPICKYGIDKDFTLTTNQIISDIADMFNHQKTIYAKDKEISLAGDEIPNKALQQLEFCDTPNWHGLNTVQISHLFFQKVAKQLPTYLLSGWQQLVQNDNGDIDQYALEAKRVGHIWQWMPTTNSEVSGYVMASQLTKNNYPVVLDFADLTYFDIRYSRKWEEPGLYWATPHAGTYQSLSVGWLSQNVKNQANIIGIEGSLWSELIPSTDHLFYMALPKMAGLAESGWSPVDQLNWQSLAKRLGCGNLGFLNYLHKVYHIRYRGYPNGIKLEVPPSTICGY